MGESPSLLELCQWRGGACSIVSLHPNTRARRPAGARTQDQGPGAVHIDELLQALVCGKMCLCHHTLQRRALGSTTHHLCKSAELAVWAGKTKASAIEVWTKFWAEGEMRRRGGRRTHIRGGRARLHNARRHTNHKHYLHTHRHHLNPIYRSV